MGKNAVNYLKFRYILEMQLFRLEIKKHNFISYPNIKMEIDKIMNVVTTVHVSEFNIYRMIRYTIHPRKA